MKYDFKSIEEKSQSLWDKIDLYKVNRDQNKPKYYVLDMFPYPSGAGLHVGHPLGYIASDIFSRYKRMKGFNVLHPMGYDAFGLPAEEYALATGIHPAVSTAENMKRYKTQLSSLGFSFDWSRELATCDPKYYKWTQWIFTQLFDHYYNLKTDKAESISSLIQIFNSEGNAHIEAATEQETVFTAEEWQAMSAKQRSDILMNYRLAYQKIGYVNWCEELGTVLANDQVKDGVSERGGYPVVQKPMTQWYLRITAYAERLLNGLDNIDWSDSLKTIQRNWIGRSEGASVFFDIKGHDDQIEIFTTRPDTIFGATYMVLAPEHDLVKAITPESHKAEVEKYVAYVQSKSEIERMAEKKITGAFTGAYAVHPFTVEHIPIWIGEYVLKDYGTGAIMAVPSDDERDNAFAQKFGLSIIDVVDKTEYPEAGMHDKVGKMINSSILNGLEVKDAIEKICKELESRGIGKKEVNYKLRDAGFSRQRYWGEPFPIIYNSEGLAEALPLESLPLELPATDDFKPGKGGRSPLSRLENWVKLPDGYYRETDIMPAVAGSSWYYLRYMDPHNEEAFASKENIDYWQDVDLYVGGSEHAVAHLMYARFWHKFLYDNNLVPTEEPFKKLVNQGMIQGVIEFIFLEKNNAQKTFVSAELINEENEDQYARIPVHIDFVSDYGSTDSYLNNEGIEAFLTWRPEFKGAIFKSPTAVYPGNNDIQIMTLSEVGKMSKSKFNVVNPESVVDNYGADTFRMYEMFLGPIEQSKPWDTKGIEGVSKFIRKFWGLFFEDDKLMVSDEAPTKEEMKILHQAIKKVTEDIEKFSFNTAVSALMICVNELRKLNCNKRDVLLPLVQLIAPFAPYTSDELWSQLGQADSIHVSDFPEFNAEYMVEDSFEYPICVNGKKRFLRSFPADFGKEEIEAEVLSLEELTKWIEGKNVIKTIVVPKRMVNVVVK
ncbi:MAG: leucine--tRNA ligase [Saprospiraceae bacterium]|nr:leucine--tRNA ligase [Saprospiraceae bacterium]